jgi:hypothetical protein
MASDYDLVVLGAGTGGLVSSLIAASIGARVALVERDRPGGDCLWTGCVPSKSLIAAAHLAHRMRHAGDVDLAPVEPEVDLASVMGHVRDAIARIEPRGSSRARLPSSGAGRSRWAGGGSGSARRSWPRGRSRRSRRSKGCGATTCSRRRASGR